MSTSSPAASSAANASDAASTTETSSKASSPSDSTQTDSTSQVAAPARAERARSTIGTVRLINAVFYGHHGVMQEEHRIGGRYEVDVSVDLDFEAAAIHDDLDETVNYEKVYAFVRELVTENNFYLIEKLAYRIANKVVEFYPNIEEVEVTVRKPNPPVGGPCDRAEATYRLAPDATA
jgi:dihydroneopterin aldolase